MKKIWCLFFLIAIVGCSKSIYRLNPDYENESFVSRKINYLPVAKENLLIDNKDDVEDDYAVDTAKAIVTIQKEMCNYMNTRTGQLVKNLRLSNQPIPSELYNMPGSDQNFPLHQEVITKGDKKVEISFRIPTIEYLNKFKLVPDVLVIFKKVRISRHQAFGMVFNAGGGFSSSDKIFCKADYIIWDYKKNQSIKCGVGEFDNDLMFGMGKSDWEHLYKTIVLEVVAETNFEAPGVH